MPQRFYKTHKTIGILLMVFLFLLLLTPWFLANSAYFAWGFTAIIFITLPLLCVVPCLLLIQLFLSYRFDLPKRYLLWAATVLICLFNAFFIWF